MNKLRIVGFLLIFSGVFTVANAQQDALYSMYMFNGITVNPAYAGSRERATVMALYRHQWTGIEGAPKTAVLSGHTPLSNENIGLGLTLSSDNISIFNTNSITVSYAYRIAFKNHKGKLSLGINATLNNFRAKWDNLIITDANDFALTGSKSNVFSPNFGAGIYYYSERFYAGISVPHFLNMSLTDHLQIEGTEMVARQWRHYFYTMGGVVNISENLKFKPSVLVKYVQNAPVQADLNAAFLINNNLWLGASYRTNKDVVLMSEYNFSKGIRIGYAYDLPMSDLSNYTAGSHEIMIGYEFMKNNSYLTPRRMSYF